MRIERVGHDRHGPATVSESERREMLLSAAERVFLAKGYVATTMADIARAAGMSKKTIYQLFASKQTLFDALMMGRLAVLRMPTDDGGQPPEEVLRAMLLDLARFALSPKQIALTRLILAAIASKPAVGYVLKARCLQVESATQAWLARQAERGVFDIPDVPTAAAMLFGIAFGDFHWHLLLELGAVPTETELAARIEQAIAVFMRAFAPRRAAADPSSGHH